jgi:hypothetical protein
VSVYGVCPKHGAVPIQGIVVTGSASITFSNNVVPCSVCGRGSRVMEGTFDFDRDGLARMLSGPQWTRDMLLRVANLAEHARVDLERANTVDKAEDVAIRFLAETENVDSALASRLLGALTSRDTRMEIYTVLGILLAAIAAVAGVAALSEGEGGGAEVTVIQRKVDPHGGPAQQTLQTPPPTLPA